MSNNMIDLVQARVQEETKLDLVQARVQEETKLLWKIDEVYWFDKEDGTPEGIIIWSYEHSIGPDDDPNDSDNENARVHYMVRAQSNMTDPTKLYALSLERGGMELLSTLLGFFGI